MRFIVDELPYYGDPCPLYSMCEDRKNREYLKIKPETDMTLEESEAFLYSLFQGEES